MSSSSVYLWASTFEATMYAPDAPPVPYQASRLLAVVMEEVRYSPA
jgi:hypothetical protein